MFERLRAAIGAWLDAASEPEGERLAAMREAAVRARMAIEAMREGVRASEVELAGERKRLEDAERRGRLAAGIDDGETVEVAERFATKHRERVDVLRRKVEAQRAELALAEREYEDMKGEVQQAERDRPVNDAARRTDAAWRAVEMAGGTRPDFDQEDTILRSDLDRRARERQADEQLEALKKRMGRT